MEKQFTLKCRMLAAPIVVQAPRANSSEILNIIYQAKLKKITKKDKRRLFFTDNHPIPSNPIYYTQTKQ